MSTLIYTYLFLSLRLLRFNCRCNLFFSLMFGRKIERVRRNVSLSHFVTFISERRSLRREKKPFFFYSAQETGREDSSFFCTVNTFSLTHEAEDEGLMIAGGAGTNRGGDHLSRGRGVRRSGSVASSTESLPGRSLGRYLRAAHESPRSSLLGKQKRKSFRNLSPRTHSETVRR